MEFFISSDTNIEAGVIEALNSIRGNGDLRRYIEKNDYGSELNRIGIIFMCRDPDLNFKQRIRLSKKDRVLSMDIMLDFNQFVVLDHDSRVNIIVQRFLTEVPAIIKKYKLKDFNLSKFEDDLKDWMVSRKLL